MNEPKFTPGPWRHQPKSGDDFYYIETEDEKYIASVPMHAYLPKREKIANAALIITAPEMYALLERLSHALFAEKCR